MKKISKSQLNKAPKRILTNKRVPTKYRKNILKLKTINKKHNIINLNAYPRTVQTIRTNKFPKISVIFTDKILKTSYTIEICMHF